jgi:hypothetical protein
VRQYIGLYFCGEFRRRSGQDLGPAYLIPVPVLDAEPNRISWAYPLCVHSRSLEPVHRAPLVLHSDCNDL